MPLTGEYEPSSWTWVHDQVQAYERSDGAEPLSEWPIVVLTSIGAKSGKLRKNPVIRVEKDGRYIAVASKGGAQEHPAWYANLVAHPLIELQDGAAKGDYRVRELSGDERADWWERAVAAYPPYAAYQENTDRLIPVMLLEPV